MKSNNIGINQLFPLKTVHFPVHFFFSNMDQYLHLNALFNFMFIQCFDSAGFQCITFENEHFVIAMKVKSDFCIYLKKKNRTNQKTIEYQYENVEFVILMPD